MNISVKWDEFRSLAHIAKANVGWGLGAMIKDSV
jgi:hypothetical protein